MWQKFNLAEEHMDAEYRNFGGTQPSMRSWMKITLALALVTGVAVSFAFCRSSPAHSADFQHTVNLIDVAAIQDFTDIILVKAFLAAWTAGNFSGANARQEMEKLTAQDFVLDESADMKNTDIFRTYKGIDEALEESINFHKIQMPDFRTTVILGVAGKVFTQQSYTPTVTSTGNTGPKMTDTARWTIKGGKISAAKVFWGNAAGWDELFDTHAPISMVKRVFALWGAGKFLGSNANLELAKLFAEDVVVDASADMKNTDMFKIYQGIDGLGQWCKNLSRMEFHHEVPVAFKGPQGLVYVYDSYEVKVLDTGKASSKIHDMQAWTFKNGKLARMKFFWGNPGAIDELFIK